MIRFPYNGRIPPRPDRSSERRVPEKRVSYEDLMKNASFSPELSFLLSMLLKDGMNQDRALDMLRDIEPYVSDGDKAAIHSILGAVQVSDEFRKSSPYLNHPRNFAGLAGFSKMSRQNSLLDVMQRYAGQDTGSMMRSLQRSLEMQVNFERMIKKMQKLRTSGTSSPEDMFEAISMFMPSEQTANIRNMQNMVRMMGSMKNFKPEDILKFMGGKS